MTVMTRRAKQRKSQAGVTLLELMVTLAVVGILGAVTYPAVFNKVKLSRRSAATTALTQVVQAQERWRANNTAYAPSLASLGINAVSAGGYYTISVATVAASQATRYTVTFAAVANTSQAKDTGCSTMNITVDSGTVSYTQPACWPT